MIALLLIFTSLAFPQTPYNGLVNLEGQLLDCGRILGRYIHGGVPSLKEDRNVRLCCNSLREIMENEGANELLLTHLNVCRQLGR